MIGNQDAAKRVRVDSYELREGDGSLDEVTGNFGKVKGGWGGRVNGDSGEGARMEKINLHHTTPMCIIFTIFAPRLPKGEKVEQNNS